MAQLLDWIANLHSDHLLAIEDSMNFNFRTVVPEDVQGAALQSELEALNLRGFELTRNVERLTYLKERLYDPEHIAQIDMTLQQQELGLKEIEICREEVIGRIEEMGKERVIQ